MVVNMKKLEIQALVLVINNIDFEDTIDNCEGSCVVKLGSTIVLCCIKAEVSEPSIDTVDQGYIGK